MPNASFNATRLSGQLLRQLRTALVTDSIVNRNYEGDISGPEDSVEITRLDALTIGDYSADTGITVETEPTGTNTTLTLPHKKYFAFIADAADNAGRYADLFEQDGLQDLLTEAQKYVLGQYTDADEQATFDATMPESTASEIDEKRLAFRNVTKEIATTLDNNEVPDRGRYMMLRPEEVRLIEDDLLNRETDLGDDVIVNGYQGSYRGFNVFKAPGSHFTNTGTSPSYNHALAGHPIAITYADAIVQTRQQPSERYFGEQVDGLHIGGAKVIRPEALVDFRIQVA